MPGSALIAAREQPLGFGPAFLRALGLETLHGTGPFWGAFRHFAQIAGSLEKTGVEILWRLIVRVRRIDTTCCFRREAGNKLGHSQTAEMGLKPLFFKAAAGGGEV